MSCPSAQESMETKTEVLDAVELALAPQASVAELQAALQARLGWAAPEGLERCALGSRRPGAAQTRALSGAG